MSRLALAASSALFAMLALEVLVRLPPLKDRVIVPPFVSPPWQQWADPTWGNPSPACYRRHPVLGYEHEVGVELRIPAAGHPAGSFLFRTNNLGLRRDTETASRPEPSRPRILVLGDSQADGYVDNDETFSALLERGLDAPGGVAPEVLNAGITGYSPAQEALWYSVRGSPLEPRLVVLLVSLANDVAELGDPSKPTVDDSGAAATAPWIAPQTPGPGRFLSDRSRVLLLVRQSLGASPLAPFLEDAGVRVFDSRAGSVPIGTMIDVLRACHGCFWQYLQQALHAREDPARFEDHLRALARIVVRLAAAIRADGARLLVALLPPRAAVEPARATPEFEPIARTLGLEAEDLARQERVEPYLEKVLAEAGISVLSLRQPLREATGRGDLYYDRDWHLSPAGHEVVAAALARAIRGGGLLARNEN